MKTSKSQILEGILTAFRYRRQMINGETNALPAFIGVAILAQGISTFAGQLSTDSRKLRGTDSLLSLLRLNQVATEPIEKAQVVVDIFVLL